MRCPITIILHLVMATFGHDVRNVLARAQELHEVHCGEEELIDVKHEMPDHNHSTFSDGHVRA